MINILEQSSSNSTLGMLMHMLLPDPMTDEFLNLIPMRSTDLFKMVSIVGPLEFWRYLGRISISNPNTN